MRVGLSDAEPLAELLRLERPGAWSAPGLISELGRRDSLGFVVRSARDVLAGALGRIVLDELHVLDVATAKSARRRGLGRMVVEALVAEARESGCREAQLELRASNEPALALYRASAFVVVGRRPRYYPDGEAALLMTRPLTSSA